MAADKLSIIVDALGLTGNRLPAASDDGSPEWAVASIAYEAAVGWLIEAHSWGFGTAIVELQRGGNSTDPLYDDFYEKPNNCFRVVWVRVNNAPADFKVIGNTINLSARGGVVTCKFVEQPTPDNWPPLFVQALRSAVMGGIYRGLNEDLSAADRQDAMARDWLQQAKTAVDQDEPKRAPFNSRLRASRMIRRPWPSSPRDWGGTGRPGS